MSMKLRAQAYGDLFRRYKETFAHCWKHRDQLNSRMLTEDEAEFLPSALALQEKPVSPAVRLVAKVLSVMIFAILAWSIFGKMDIVVNASGKVIPSGHAKTVASIDVATVKALHIEEGQKVNAGDVLIELDASASDAERDKASGDRSAALLQAARSKALIEAIDGNRAPKMPLVEGVPQEKWDVAKLHLDGLYRDFASKLQRIDGDITRYAQALPLAAQRASDYKALLVEKDVSHHAWLEKEQARVDLAGQLADARNQRSALIAETRRMAFDQMNEATKVADASQQDAIRSDARSRQFKITAPVTGTVQQLDVHTVGGVVTAAKPLMIIVPENEKVELETFIENKDVGFVHEGQTVAVKFEAFEYTKYGTVPGTVSHVSMDAIQDEKKGLIYSVKIMLDQNRIDVDGKKLRLAPGMAVTADIKTGDRRVIEYVLSPLVRHQKESFNER